MAAWLWDEILDLSTGPSAGQDFKRELYKYLGAGEVVTLDGYSPVYVRVNSVNSQFARRRQLIKIGFSLVRRKPGRTDLGELERRERRRVPVAPEGFEEFYVYTFRSGVNSRRAIRGFENFVRSMVESPSAALRPRPLSRTGRTGPSRAVLTGLVGDLSRVKLVATSPQVAVQVVGTPLPASRILGHTSKIRPTEKVRRIERAYANKKCEAVLA